MQYFTNNFFADADSAYDNARYIIFGVPYDGTTSYLAGTRRGPKAIREVTYNFEAYLPEYDLDLTDVPIADIGDLEPYSLPDAVVEQVKNAVSGFCKDGKIPIMLGGEHSVTPGAVKALKPDCFVVCDAHLDLRDEYGGTPFNHACATRRVFKDGVKKVFIIGARSGTREEFEFAAENLHLYTADDVRSCGINNILDEIAGMVSKKKIYLSIDADVIDCCLTPGLGTPEPFGLTPFDIREVIRSLAPYTVGFDYVEVCPVDAGQTAAVAAKLIREFIAVHYTETILK